jgi:fumarate reductase subunit D
MMINSFAGAIISQWYEGSLFIAVASIPFVALLIAFMILGVTLINYKKTGSKKVPTRLVPIVVTLCLIIWVILCLIFGNYYLHHQLNI